MDNTKQNRNIVWEHRQAELWDRIFQVTQDTIALAGSLEEDSGGDIIREEMVRAAMYVGKYLVRATAANTAADFQKYVEESRLKAIEADYWLRLAYIAQQREEVQRDLSSIITQYSSIIELLQKMGRHFQGQKESNHQVRGPKVNL